MDRLFHVPCQWTCRRDFNACFGTLYITLARGSILDRAEMHFGETEYETSTYENTLQGMMPAFWLAKRFSESGGERRHKRGSFCPQYV